jgi:hypothetical protein
LDRRRVSAETSHLKHWSNTHVDQHRYRLARAPSSREHTAFLVNLLNDYITFDDAEYPEDYDRTIDEGDDGYVTPVLRQEWNAGAAAAWGFTSREQIEAALG